LRQKNFFNDLISLLFCNAEFNFNLALTIIFSAIIITLRYQGINKQETEK